MNSLIERMNYLLCSYRGGWLFSRYEQYVIYYLRAYFIGCFPVFYGLHLLFYYNYREFLHLLRGKTQISRKTQLLTLAFKKWTLDVIQNINISALFSLIYMMQEMPLLSNNFGKKKKKRSKSKTHQSNRNKIESNSLCVTTSSFS